MGHMHRLRQGIRSSTKITMAKMIDKAMAAEPQLDPPRGHIDCKHFVGVNTVKFENLKGIISTDLPGRFPITSARGNAHVLVLYDFDSNSILAVPIKNRRKHSLVRGYQQCLVELTRAGIKPILHRVDNEISNDMIAEIEQKSMAYHISAPGDHRLNFAKGRFKPSKFTSYPSSTDVTHNSLPTNGTNCCPKPS
jgi:hypothetical protein